MKMSSAGVLTDLDSVSIGPGAIVDSSGISVAKAEKRGKDVIKCGFLWKRGTGISSARVSSRARYYVLTKAALEYYRNEKCVSTKSFFSCQFMLYLFSCIEIQK